MSKGKGSKNKDRKSHRSNLKFVGKDRRKELGIHSRMFQLRGVRLTGRLPGAPFLYTTPFSSVREASEAATFFPMTKEGKNTTVVDVWDSHTDEIVWSNPSKNEMQEAFGVTLVAYDLMEGRW